MNQEQAYSFNPEVRQDLTADGHLSGVEVDPGEDDKQEPFDPERISIDPKVVSMDAIIRRLLQGSIRLAPAFQRKEIWDVKRKSLLIESLMLKIPIPMFYVAADKKGNWDVVDGLQRLTTIKEFILGNKYMETRDDKYRGDGLRLRGLEFWSDAYDGSNFKKLPESLINRILETEFRFTVINPGTPEEVKRNIFKRVNIGGMPLTFQEIRHALYQGKSTKLLEELVETDAFKTAIDNSVNDSRMAARELVLRFIAFSIRAPEAYPKTAEMDTFLSDTMRLVNIMPEMPGRELKKIFKDSEPPALRFTDIEFLKSRFEKGMVRAYELFGRHTFRKSFGENRRAPINKTLFEAWGNLLADLDDDAFERAARDKETLLDKYHILLDDQYFANLISRNSWKRSGVKSRYKKLRELLDPYTKN